MIPQRLQHTQEEKVVVPQELKRWCTLYELYTIAEKDLVNLLQGELDLHPEFSDAVRARVMRVIKKLERDADARELCKQETGIAAVATQKERKIEW